MRALILCGDPFHDGAMARCSLMPLAVHGFEFEWVEDGRAITGLLLEQFPLVVLAKSNAVSEIHRRPWLGKDSQTIFRRYAQNGNGLVVLHSGIAGYKELPAVRQTVGGAFLHHPKSCAVTMEPQAGHPLAEEVPPFTVRDEHYFVEVDEPAVEVFLHSHSRHGRQPAGWIRTDKRGRVCVLTPGHSLKSRMHTAYQKLLLNTLRWAGKLNGT